MDINNAVKNLRPNQISSFIFNLSSFHLLEITPYFNASMKRRKQAKIFIKIQHSKYNIKKNCGFVLVSMIIVYFY